MTRLTFIVHGLDDCRAALAAAADVGVPVTLRSAPGAAAYLGAPAFRKMTDAAAGEYPDTDAQAVLDCGADPGLALAAFRHGLKRVRVDVAGDVRTRIADIASQCDAALDDDPAPALDLGDAVDLQQACRTWIDRASVRPTNGAD